MSLFRHKIKIRREDQGDNRLIILDYHRAGSPQDFLIDILRAFVGQNRSIAVIDTELSYNEPKSSENTKELYRYLEEQKLLYKDVIVVSDYQGRYMGIPITTDQIKSKFYKIAILLTQEDILPFLEMNKYNTHYYIGLNSEYPLELLQSFQMAKGEMDTLEAASNYHLYVDYYLSKLRILHRKELTEEAERLLLQFYAM